MEKNFIFFSPEDIDFTIYVGAEKNTSLDQQQNSLGLFFNPVGVFLSCDIFIKHMLLLKNIINGTKTNYLKKPHK